MAWTDDRIEQVRTLWQDDKKTTTQIAAVLGDVTRGAVIGIIHRRRDGWTGDRAAAIKHSAPKVRGKVSIPKAKPKAVVPEALVIPEYKDGAQVTVMTLTTHTCRWPIGTPGEPDFHFCAAHSDRGKSYCEAHRAIASPTGTIYHGKRAWS